jgi:ribokinase
MSFDVVGFGALNVDKLYNVNKIAHEDEESYITGLTESYGGSAANTIVGLSRLGLNTGFIGKVASDREGTLLLKNLEDESVDIDGVILESDGRSGVVSGFIDRDGQRALYVDPGVNDLIEQDEVQTDYVTGSKVLHMASFVGKFEEKSIKAQKAFLKRIPDDISVSLDPGRLYAERGMDFLEKFLEMTNIILINEAELNLLTDEKYRENYKGNKSCENGSKILLDYGIDIVAVKRGDKGVYVTDGCQSYFINAFKVQCVDTTGAGDAFNAGFLYGLIKGENIEKSGLIGNFVASKCVEECGATNGLPDVFGIAGLTNSFK